MVKRGVNMISKKILLALSLSMILLLSGCININVEQKLKRNGHYDMDLTISTSPEYKMILNGLKEGFQVDDSVKGKFDYKETDTSITYSFKDINPTTDKKLFKEIEKKEGSENDMFGQTQETPDSSFIDPENIDFKKEFKFPYYEYTYTLKMSPESKKDTGKVEVLTSNDYILDEANILDQPSKNQIMQSINNVYKNDSIEIIIVTKKQMEQMDYWSYKYDFTSNFNFKNKNKQYIMIFASTNENGLCSVESNIYLDSKVSAKINTLNTDFEKNCKLEYSTQIKNVVTQLDSFFKTADLESSKQMEEQLGQLFKVGYTIEIFGKITETNGLKMGDNKVKFDINPSKNGEYRIVFKDFFLASILGDFYWVYLIIAGVILVGGVGFVVISKHRKNLQSKPLEAPLAVNPQIMDYVRRARMNGMPDQQIKSNLMQCGWNSKDIDIALKLR